MNIAEARKAQGLSQAELATKAGVNLAIITKLEQGITDITKTQAATIERIAQALDIPAGTLLADDNEFEHANGRLVVDELVYDPHCAGSDIVIRIHDKWYRKNIVGIERIKPYLRPVTDDMPRARHNHEYLFTGTIPRGGFKRPTPLRAATDAEIAELSERYGKPEPARKQTLGAAFGKDATITITSVRYTVGSEAVDVEQGLRNRGIEASNRTFNTVDVRIA